MSAQIVIASLKHTHKYHEHITFWGPDKCGYRLVIDGFGIYSDHDGATLNDGIDYIAVPLTAVLAIASPTPYYTINGRAATFYDVPGEVIDNTRGNWSVLIAASLSVGRISKPKPELFRGKRRSFSIERIAA